MLPPRNIHHVHFHMFVLIYLKEVRKGSERASVKEQKGNGSPGICSEKKFAVNVQPELIYRHDSMALSISIPLNCL